MSIDRSGSLVCEYCGSKTNFSDRELEQYKEFRGQMLNYLRNLHDTSEGNASLDALWNHAEETQFRTTEGADIHVRYLYMAQDGPATMYVTRNAVLYYFEKEHAFQAEKMKQGLDMLEFPAADIKGLDRCFPKLTGDFDLQEGGRLLAFSREETVFPLAVYGALSYVHVAWVVSRLENICCTLEYSGLVQGGINVESVFINSETHEAILYGGWWDCRKKTAIDQTMGNKDLTDFRRTCEKALGQGGGDAPKGMLDFLHKKPMGVAYDDFQVWDQVIEKDLGGRHFHKMNANDGMKI